MYRLLLLKDGDTALHLACSSENHEHLGSNENHATTVRLLLDMNADVTLMNNVCRNKEIAIS